MKIELSSNCEQDRQIIKFATSQEGRPVEVGAPSFEIRSIRSMLNFVLYC